MTTTQTEMVTGEFVLKRKNGQYALILTHIPRNSVDPLIKPSEAMLKDFLTQIYHHNVNLVCVRANVDFSARYHKAKHCFTVFDLSRDKSQSEPNQPVHTVHQSPQSAQSSGNNRLIRFFAQWLGVLRNRGSK